MGHEYRSATTDSLFSRPNISSVSVPDSALCHAITEFVRDTETDLLFNHSSRVYYFGAIAGQQRGLSVNRELLYAATMFHDVGLMPSHSTADLRFEVDGANAARDFLKGQNVDPSDIEKVWNAIALHTTPGVPEFMHPVIALTTAGVEMDVLGLTYDQYTDEIRQAIVAAFPRTLQFKEDIIQAFYDGNRHKPLTTFGNVNADVIADKERHFCRADFCSLIRCSGWKA